MNTKVSFKKFMMIQSKNKKSNNKLIKSKYICLSSLTNFKLNSLHFSMTMSILQDNNTLNKTRCSFNIENYKSDLF